MQPYATLQFLLPLPSPPILTPHPSITIHNHQVLATNLTPSSLPSSTTITASSTVI
jgi:hypothetical protein